MPEKVFQAEEELDVNEIRKKIRNSSIQTIPYATDVEKRPGRPTLDFVLDCLSNKLGKLYRAIKGRKGRVVLSFYLSSKYDLKTVVKFVGKNLKVITYYNFMKRKKVRGRASRR